MKYTLISVSILCRTFDGNFILCGPLTSKWFCPPSLSLDASNRNNYGHNFVITDQAKLATIYIFACCHFDVACARPHPQQRARNGNRMQPICLPPFIQSGSYQQLKLGIASETLFGNSSPNTEIRADWFGDNLIWQWESDTFTQALVNSGCDKQQLLSVRISVDIPPMKWSAAWVFVESDVAERLASLAADSSIIVERWHWSLSKIWLRENSDM